MSVVRKLALALVTLTLFFGALPAKAQEPQNAVSAQLWCKTLTNGLIDWKPCDSTTPLVVNDTSFAAKVASTVPRVGNTTTYTANTGWCNTTSACTTVFTFANVCRANGTLVLVPQIEIYSSANPATKLSGVLWLFNVTPGTVINDNATFNIAAADFANLVNPAGFSFSLGSVQASGAANSGATLAGTTYVAQCAAGSTSLFGMVEVTNAYVPASGEVLTVTLKTVGVN